MNRLKTLLELLRLPALFTAMADIFAGYLFGHESLAPARDFVCLLASSSCIYLGGMVLNDVCDVVQDHRERPGRPIPSGRVRRGTALALAVALLAAGVAMAACVSAESVVIAAALVGCVIAYDALLKRTLAGPLVMGACRGLNISLAMSTSAMLGTGPALYVALSLGFYVAGVTWFARREASSTARWQLAISSAVIDLAIASLVGLLVLESHGQSVVRYAYYVVILLLLVWVGRATYSTIEEPGPGKVQAAVGKALMGIVLFDAAIVCAVRGPVWAAAVVALVIPATLLSRRVSPT